MILKSLGFLTLLGKAGGRNDFRYYTVLFFMWGIFLYSIIILLSKCIAKLKHETRYHFLKFFPLFSRIDILFGSEEQFCTFFSLSFLNRSRKISGPQKDNLVRLKWALEAARKLPLLHIIIVIFFFWGNDTHLPKQPSGRLTSWAWWKFRQGTVIRPRLERALLKSKNFTVFINKKAKAQKSWIRNVGPFWPKKR